MRKVEAFGYIESGQLKITGRKRLDMALKAMPDMDVEIIIKKRGKATDAQRRYYFGVVVKEITARLKEMGNDVDEELTHEFLKLEFNKNYLRDEDGTVIGTVGGTTTEQNIEERAEFIERCIRWAAETLELSIPAPNSQAAFF